MQTRNKQKKGFTLIELLGAIAILIVLFGLSVPAVNGLKTKLEMIKLNNISREIYVAAQNRVIHEKNSVGLTGLASSIENATGTAYKLDSFGKTDAPADFPTKDADLWKSFYAVQSNSSGPMSYILPATEASFISNGAYIIEIDPRTGNVFSVFYSEKNNASALATLYKGALYSSRTDAADQKKFRTDNLVGYYNGSADGFARNGLSPKITINNLEDLYAEIEIANMPEGTYSAGDLELVFTFENERGESFSCSSKELGSAVVFQGPGAEEGIGTVMRAYLLIDTIDQGNLIDYYVKNYNVSHPGSEIAFSMGCDTRITVDAVLNYGEVVHTRIEAPSKTSASFNTLFDDSTVYSADATSDVRVSNVRQLNNLNSSKYPDDMSNASVEIVSGIDFAKTTWADELCAEFGRKSNPIASVGFTPIVNDALFGKEGSAGGGSVNGNNNEISNFVINNSNGSNGTGLFAYTNCDISNVRINMARIPDSGSDNNIGSLVGIAYGGTIDQCGAYLDCVNHEYYDNPDAMANVVKDHTLAGSNYVGGLVGYAGAAEITNSFGAVNVACTQYAGGLVGYAAGTRISNCYGSGEISGKTLLASNTSYAGGITGYGNAATISNCYSTSYIQGTSYCGGIAGTTNSGTVSGCTFLGNIENSVNNGPIRTGNASVSNCSFLQQTGNNEGFTAGTGYTIKEYDDLATEAIHSVQNSHPYVKALLYTDKDHTPPEKAKAFFPFKYNRIGDTIIDHYGNWPIRQEVEKEDYCAIVYYEKYVDDDGNFVQYGYHTNSGTSATQISSLLTQEELDEKHLHVIEDGYGFASVQKVTGNYNYAINGGTSKQVKNQNIVRLGKDADGKDTLGGRTYYFIRLPQDAQTYTTSTNANFYYTININKGGKVNYTCYYNPLFAKCGHSFESNNTAVRPAYPSVVFIRTPRQLNNLARHDIYWNTTNKITFTQELDLDYASYTKNYFGLSGYDLMNTASTNTYRNVPIGTSSKAFTNNYDGHGTAGTKGTYEIIDYCLETGTDCQYTGLFGYVNGSTIKNVHMVASDPGLPNEDSNGYVKNTYAYNKVNNMGGLVGYMTSSTTVTNCSISGYDISATASTNDTQTANSALGGLIGYSAGKITNCASVNKTVILNAKNLSSRYYHGSLGGLCGETAEGSRQAPSTLTDCYAGGMLVMTNNSSYAYTGGVCGYSENTVSNSYSYCEVQNTGNGTLYGVARKTTNCYYLNTGFEASRVTGTTRVLAPGLINAGLGDSFALVSDDSKTYYQWEKNTTNPPDPYPTCIGEKFPFKSSVKDHNGNNIHYGNWLAYEHGFDAPTVGYVHFNVDWNNRTKITIWILLVPVNIEVPTVTIDQFVWDGTEFVQADDEPFISSTTGFWERIYLMWDSFLRGGSNMYFAAWKDVALSDDVSDINWTIKVNDKDTQSISSEKDILSYVDGSILRKAPKKIVVHGERAQSTLNDEYMSAEVIAEGTVPQPTHDPEFDSDTSKIGFVKVYKNIIGRYSYTYYAYDKNSNSFVETNADSFGQRKPEWNWDADTTRLYFIWNNVTLADEFTDFKYAVKASNSGEDSATITEDSGYERVDNVNINNTIDVTITIKRLDEEGAESTGDHSSIVIECAFQ